MAKPDRAERLRQDHAVQRHHRLRAGRTRARSGSATGRSPTWRRTRCSRPGIGRTFQLTRIFARLTVLENMLVAAQARDKPRNLLSWFGRDAWTHHRRHAMELLEFVGIERHADLLLQARSPTASASCSSSPTCWSPTRPSILLDEPSAG